MNLFKSYKKGTILIKEGDYSKYNYFVLKGCLRTYYIIDGLEKTTSFYLEEDIIFAETPIHGKFSEYYLICEEDSILFRTSKEEEQFVLSNFPEMAIRCNSLFKKEVVKQQAKFNFHSIYTPEEKYISLIKNTPELLQRVPQYQIASYIGIKPESLSRIKKRIS